MGLECPLLPGEEICSKYLNYASAMEQGNGAFKKKKKKKRFFWYCLDTFFKVLL